MTAPRDLRTAVVIVNYRTPDLVRDCLASLAPQVDPDQDRIVVVDNASGDGSPDAIEAAVREAGWEDRVQVERAARNGGFSAGNNIGLDAVHARDYVLLNSDTIVEPGAVEALREAADRSPKAGIVAPRLLDVSGEAQVSCFRFPRPASELLWAARTGPISRCLRRYEVALPVEPLPESPDWVSFACVLVRGDAVRDVGPLDDAFFMYFEDVDYCRRLRRAGWGVATCEAARVVHLHGGSSGIEDMTARRLPRYYYASRAHYFAIHHGRFGLWAANLLWMLGRSVSFLRELVGSKTPHLPKRQLRDIWIGAWSSASRAEHPS